MKEISMVQAYKGIYCHLHGGALPNSNFRLLLCDMLR